MCSVNGNVLEDTIGVRRRPRTRRRVPRPPNVGFGGRRRAWPRRGSCATSFTTWVTREHELLVLADVRGPCPRRSMCGQDRFSSEARPRPSLLAGAGAARSAQCSELRVRSGARHDRQRDASTTIAGKAFLDPARPRDTTSRAACRRSAPVPRRMEGRAGALLHRQMRRIRVGAQEFRLRPQHVDHRMKADGLGHDAAPAGLERADDVGLGLGRRRRQSRNGF